ncbi:MAG TPA: YggS family pyridoxal phosphate-dependent enzyme [Anaerolineales bacterium]
MIAENYLRVLERIARAAQSAGRAPDSVRLVVVTKGHPAQSAREAIEAGAKLLGENYAEEGVAKKQALLEAAPVEWHMIGHVQSRKARLVCENFAWVHSLDSGKLADRLDTFAGELGRVLPVLLECNVSGEETKHGWPSWQPETWPALLPGAARLASLPNLKVRGLMTMAPYLPDPELARPYFRRLRLLQEYFARNIPGADWSELSMGMSGDFEAAIQEGATLVRIGTAIMGPRPVV